MLDQFIVESTTFGTKSHENIQQGIVFSLRGDSFSIENGRVSELDNLDS